MVKEFNPRVALVVVGVILLALGILSPGYVFLAGVLFMRGLFRLALIAIGIGLILYFSLKKRQG